MSGLVPGGKRRAARAGIAVVAALILLGLAFLVLLVQLTKGRMRPPPEELRDRGRARPEQGR